MDKVNFARLKYYDKNRHATWLELFFDLVFVAGIGSSAHILAHTHSGHIEWGSIVAFIVSFTPLWWIWSTHTCFSNKFDTDTRGMRLVTLSIMLLFTLMAAVFSDHILGHYKYKWFVIFYAFIRFIQAAKYFYVSSLAGEFQAFAKRMVVVITVGALLAVPTMFLEENLKAYFLVGIIVCEMIGVYFVTKNSKIMRAHQSHLVERIGLLSIILLGESIIALVGGLRGAQWENMSILTTVTGFTLIGFIWWIYFDSFPYLERARKFGHGFALVYSHFAFCVGLAMLANLILLTITSKISVVDFQIQAIVGMTLFYIGKQFSYFVYFPTYRLNNVVNSVVCIGVTALSVMFMQPKYALIGMTLAMAIYTFSNLYWTLKKDAKEFLLPAEH